MAARGGDSEFSNERSPTTIVSETATTARHGCRPWASRQTGQPRLVHDDWAANGSKGELIS